MPFTKFTNLDFDQIKTSIKDYLRANSNFTDFDFEGSNFSVLIDTLAYNTYITAFNANMTVNESFLDSATVRENVVALARNVGYVPRSRVASEAKISFTATTSLATELTLRSGLVCIGTADNTSYTFCITENITSPIVNGVASFSNISIYQGNYLTKQFTVDGSLDQRFILENAYVDTSKIIVYVKGSSDSGLGIKYNQVENIVNITSTSKIFLIQEVQDEKYELLFGDGYFGKKLENGAIITVQYITTDGKSGNGVENFAFQGSFTDQTGVVLTPTVSTITTNQKAINGTESENINSIKYFAPRLYSSQYRAVTSSDYEAIISNKIYPNTESISVVGGEELSPPQFGNILISIKPKNWNISLDFDKSQILSKLRQYSVSGINPKIIDLKILYVEIDSYVYYNYNQVSSGSDLKTKITSSLTKYSESVDLNKFGGRFKYSKVLQVIDNTDVAVTSNITRVKVRRDLKAIINEPTQYELCFGNQFHVNSSGYNIKSTGFKVFGESETVYLTDTPNKDGKTGVISVVKPIKNASGISTSQPDPFVVVQSAGVVDYIKGEITLNTLRILSTNLQNNIIEVQAYPESNDVIGLKDLYVSFDTSKSKINMLKDVIASGEDISGVVFSRDYYTSSIQTEN